MANKTADSFITRLTGKQENYITTIQERNRNKIPAQGQTTGGYTQQWIQFSQLPLYPLHSDKQLELMRFQMDKEGGSKTVALMAMEQIQLAVFTRYAIPSRENPPRFVDTLEFHFIDKTRTRAFLSEKLGGNVIILKAGLPSDRKVSMKVFDAEVRDLKGQKTWDKHRGVKEFCQGIYLVQDGVEYAMPVVARIQRACGQIERREMEERFGKAWKVPVL